MFSDLVGYVVALGDFMVPITQLFENATALVLAIAAFVVACKALMKSLKQMR